MQRTIEQKFMASIRWNTLEGVLQNLLLFGHHLLLFKVVSPTLFGEVGSIIASSYLLATVASAGFYAIIGSSFHTWRGCQRTFLTHITPHIIGSGCAGMVLALVGMTIATHYLPITKPIDLIVCALVASEAVRETLKATIQTIFANKAHTTISTLAIIAYCAIVWSYYAGGALLTVQTLLLPLLVTSFAANTALLCTIVWWFWGTSKRQNLVAPCHKELLKTRLHGATYTLGTLPFNGNLLIPALAWHTGFAGVASLKLANDATHYIGNLMRKALYAASHSLFTHTRTANGTICPYAWCHARTTLHCMMLWGLPLAVTTGCAAALIGAAYLPALLAFGLLKLCDCLLAPHETRCLVEGKTRLLALLGTASFLIIATLFLLPKVAPGALLCAVATTRLGGLFLLWRSPKKCKIAVANVAKET